MLRSTVFRLTLLYSLAFILVAVLLGWAAGSAFLSALDDNERADHQEALEWVVERYDEDGLPALLEEFGEEEPELWEQDHALFMLYEEGLLLALRSPGGDTLLGYSGLVAAAGWQWLDFEDVEEVVEVRVLEATLADGASVLLARPRDHEYHVVRETMDAGLFWLFALILPLSLLMGYGLSRAVYRQLARLSETVDAVGEGNLGRRAPLRGNDDEFDRLATAMNAMLDRIEALHSNLETASVGIAHDLKTPLARISNRLQLMMQDIEDPDSLRAHLDVAQAQLQGVTQTFQGLLRLGEIESGERRERFSSLDLSALVQDVIDSYEPVFTDASRALDVSVVPAITLRGDADLLVQMLTNLLENSIEHGRDGGQTWVRLQASPDGCVLQVGDDGPGIPPAQRGRIFERFFRGDSSRGAPGNGLGLAIVKAVCELHDGHVVLLDNQPGAVFDCYFPGTGH